MLVQLVPDTGLKEIQALAETNNFEKLVKKVQRKSYNIFA